MAQQVNGTWHPEFCPQDQQGGREGKKNLYKVVKSEHMHCGSLEH